MIGAARRWLRRNSKGLAIGASVLGAGYLAGQYLLSKWSDARERMSSDNIARENLRRRFEQEQIDCTYNTLGLLPAAANNIIDALPVEELTNELQKKRAEKMARIRAGEATSSEMSSVAPSLLEDDQNSTSSFQSESFMHTSQLGDSADFEGQSRVKRTKTQLWNEVKITSITRAFTMIYTLSLLTIFTRVQLNLLGRRRYLSSVISLATPQTDAAINLEDLDDDLSHTLGDDPETNLRYVTFSWWLLHRGWREIMQQVRSAVEELTGSLNVRGDISRSQLSELIVSIREKVEGGSEEERRSKNWLSCLLPPQEEEDYVLSESGVNGLAEKPSPQTASKLRRLLDETADLVESPSFALILTKLNGEGFSALLGQAFPNPSPNEGRAPAPQSFDSVATVIPAPPREPKTKLANLLALLARQAHVIGSGLPSHVSPHLSYTVKDLHQMNGYLAAMVQGVGELEAFSAVIYSSNFDPEILGAGRKAAEAVAGESANQDYSTSPFEEHVENESQFVTLDEMQVLPVPLDDAQFSDLPQESSFEAVWGKAVEDR